MVVRPPRLYQPDILKNYSAVAVEDFERTQRSEAAGELLKFCKIVFNCIRNHDLPIFSQVWTLQISETCQLSTKKCDLLRSNSKG